MTKRGVLAGLASGVLGGCSPLSAFNALTPRPSGVTVTSDLAYGSLPRQKLDVYRPISAVGPLPLMAFFYGGGWESGDRGQYAFAGRAYAAQGFVTVVADYRVTAEAPYPAFIEDCARAVAWAQTHASDFGADARRTVLAGHSAGAYNAAMLALDRRWLKDARAPAQVCGWAGLSGPYDFLPLAPGPGLRTFGRVADQPSTQPINYATPGDPPAYLVCGEKDKLVMPRNTERLARRLRAEGVVVEERVYPNIGHAETVLALAWPLKRRLPILRESAAFLHAATGRAPKDSR